MNTLEKVAAKLDEAQDLDDDELHLIPFLPPTLVRAALRFVAKRLPEDSEEMEDHVHRAIEFLQDLLPDPEWAEVEAAERDVYDPTPERSGTLELPERSGTSLESELEPGLE